MAQKQWITRAGRGLLDVLTLLLRSAGALCAAISSVVLFLFANEGGQDGDESTPDSQAGDRIVGQDEAEHYGWDSW